MPPNNLIDPHHRHPDRRAEGPERRDPFKQPFHKAPDAMTQLHERCRFATLKNGFLDPRCFARNDDDGATRHTTTDRMNSTQGQGKPQRITETTEPR